MITFAPLSSTWSHLIRAGEACGGEAVETEGKGCPRAVNEQGKKLSKGGERSRKWQSKGSERPKKDSEK